MIQIRITDIPTRGLELKQELSAELLNARMAEAPDNDILFSSNPLLNATIKPIVGGAELTGNILAQYTQPCGVCLSEIDKEIDSELQISLKPNPRSSRRRSSKKSEEQAQESCEDDIGIVYFEGEHIELEEVIQESIILLINPFDYAHSDCKGLPEDHLPEEQDSPTTRPTFADLIKQAKSEK